MSLRSPHAAFSIAFFAALSAEQRSMDMRKTWKKVPNDIGKYAEKCGEINGKMAKASLEFLMGSHKTTSNTEQTGGNRHQGLDKVNAKKHLGIRQQKKRRLWWNVKGNWSGLTKSMRS